MGNVDVVYNSIVDVNHEGSCGGAYAIRPCGTIIAACTLFRARLPNGQSKNDNDVRMAIFQTSIAVS